MNRSISKEVLHPWTMLKYLLKDLGYFWCNRGKTFLSHTDLYINEPYCKLMIQLCFRFLQEEIKLSTKTQNSLSNPTFKYYLPNQNSLRLNQWIQTSYSLDKYNKHYEWKITTFHCWNFAPQRLTMIVTKNNNENPEPQC